MTVKELKQALNECNDDDIVVVRGYEEGVDEVRHISVGYCSSECTTVPDWEGARAFNKKEDNFFKDKSIWLRA